MLTITSASSSESEVSQSLVYSPTPSDDPNDPLVGAYSANIPDSSAQGYLRTGVHGGKAWPTPLYLP
jgi:hypothetical protein